VKILIADDDAVLVDLIGFLFKREGFTVSVALDGEEALRVIRRDKPDMVILDLRYPKRSGIDVLKEIRQTNTMPVIILTATGDEETIVKLLGMGADDFVVKPFQPRELVARVKALMRRTEHRREKPEDLLTCGEIQVDPARREALVAGEPARLTPTEFKVLEYLVINAGKVVSVDELAECVWGNEKGVTDDVVKVTMMRLRRKIEPEPSKPRYIISVPGEGYMCENRN
jgi:DNA-binding response OmpR family regulator